jgi:hypothetical protein
MSTFAIVNSPPSTLAKDFKVISLAFGHQAPFVDIYFPEHDTDEGSAQGTQRLATWQESSNNSYFVHAVADPGSKEATINDGILGFAIWTRMTELPPQELDEAEDVHNIWGRLQGGREKEEYMRQMWRSYVKPRTEAVKQSEGKGVYGTYF